MTPQPGNWWSSPDFARDILSGGYLRSMPGAQQYTFPPSEIPYGQAVIPYGTAVSSPFISGEQLTEPPESIATPGTTGIEQLAEPPSGLPYSPTFGPQQPQSLQPGAPNIYFQPPQNFVPATTDIRLAQAGTPQGLFGQIAGQPLTMGQEVVTPTDIGAFTEPSPLPSPSPTPFQEGVPLPGGLDFSPATPIYMDYPSYPDYSGLYPNVPLQDISPPAGGDFQPPTPTPPSPGSDYVTGLPSGLPYEYTGLPGGTPDYPSIPWSGDPSGLSLTGTPDFSIGGPLPGLPPMVAGAPSGQFDPYAYGGISVPPPAGGPAVARAQPAPPAPRGIYDLVPPPGIPAVPPYGAQTSPNIGIPNEPGWIGGTPFGGSINFNPDPYGIGIDPQTGRPLAGGIPAPGGMGGIYGSWGGDPSAPVYPGSMIGRPMSPLMWSRLIGESGWGRLAASMGHPFPSYQQYLADYQSSGMGQAGYGGTYNAPAINAPAIAGGHGASAGGIQ
jgi:hypothetical protein